MKNEPRNIAESVANRLKNKAKGAGLDYNAVLLLYMQERFLYRLSQSPYRNQFILKGGLLLLTLDNEKSRPTRDIDLLARQINNKIDVIYKAMKEICLITSLDGISYRLDSLSITEIIENAFYMGIRIEIMCNLGKIRNRLQIDLGFGDAVVPEPVEIAFPVLLDTTEIPIINTYSLDSVIAEKFEAMIKLSIINSRMKDFFDIYRLSKTHDFAGSVLKEAISQTFKNRKTDMPSEPIIFKEEFRMSSEKQKEWTVFRARLHNPDVPQEFSAVMEQLYLFVTPVYQSIVSNQEFSKLWIASENQWRGNG